MKIACVRRLALAHAKPDIVAAAWAEPEFRAR
jgi:hypothetical protein